MAALKPFKWSCPVCGDTIEVPLSAEGRPRAIAEGYEVQISVDDDALTAVLAHANGHRAEAKS